MRKKLREKILKISWEIFATPIDLVLFTLMMAGEISFSGGNYTMKNLIQKLDRLVLEGKDRLIRDAICRAKYKGWIKENFQLTKEGKKRLFNYFPQFLSLRHWDGNWYLSIFDIPEKLHHKRDIFRDNLKKLGFGQLQQSTWIAAVNYLKNVEDLIKSYQLDSYVILAQTNKLGKETSQSLANKIWKLDKIDKLYVKFISEWEKSSKDERFWLLLKYFNLLRKDPQLPLELLPENWQGIKAYRLVKEYLKKNKDFQILST